MRIHRYVGILVLGMSVLHFLAPPIPWAAKSYTIEEVGGGEAIKAVGPNLSGQAAVRSGFVDASSSLRMSGAAPEKIGLLPGGDNMTAYGINDRSDVVGSATTTLGTRRCRPDIPEAPPSGICSISTVHAVISTKAGGLRDIGTLPGDSASEALGINNPGAVVGYSSGPRGARAFLWAPDGGTMQNLGTLPGGDFSKAFGISDNGLVVGSSGSPVGTRAVLWSLGRIQDLGTLPGDTASEALAISNRGNVVGYSRGPAGLRAFLWTSKDGMQSLGALPGGTFSSAVGITEAGEVVGSAGSPQGIRAVLWDNKGEPQDLNALVSIPAGLVLMSAVGINASGQILVLGKDEKDIHGNHEGPSRVFLLTPGKP